MSNNYKLTFLGCFFGLAGQAVITNLTAILFVPFMQLYGLELWQLGVLIGVNFLSQLVADVILTAIIDKVDYRKPILIAQTLAAVGLVFFALVPNIFPRSGIFIGFLIATVVFAFSGGMQEVIISPMVDAFPDSKSKSFMMSVLHSFYAWGQVLAVVITALWLFLFDSQSWQIITALWAILPLVALVIFCVCPVSRRIPTKGEQTKAVFSPIMLFCMLAIFLGGGTEITANQYVSTFCVLSLGFEKYVADLVGMGLFAACMGVGRVLFAKISIKVDMNKILIVTAASTFLLYLVAGLSPLPVVSMVAAILCGFSSSVLWPGVLTVAGAKFPKGGALIFALLAIFGDVGGSLIPTVIGFVADNSSLETAFTIGSIVPLCCLICHLCVAFISNKKTGKVKEK